MAACGPNVLVCTAAYAFVSTPQTDGRSQVSPSTLCLCSGAASSQRKSGALTLSKGAGGRPSRRRLSLWGHRQQQSRQQQQRRTEAPSTSRCLPTEVDVSSNASAPSQLNATDGNESVMSVEEKNEILAFEAGGSCPDRIDSPAEQSNSSEDLQLSSSEEEEEGKAVQAAKERGQEFAELKRRASKAVKGQGATVTNVLVLFVGLLDRSSPGDGKMVAGAGSAVIERVEEEVFKLQGVEGVDEQIVFEILRLVKLLQMDIQLIAAARKDSTLSERLVQTKTHCREFLNLLSML